MKAHDDMKRSKRFLVGGARTCRSDVIVSRVVNIAVLVLLPIVSSSLSSSSFYLNQATRPININKRHTDRQIDSVSKRKNQSNTRCTIKHSKTHKNADGHTH